MAELVDYVYLVGLKYILRLNLTDILNSEAFPSLESVIDTESTNLPLGAGYFNMDFKLYCVGGEKKLPDSDDEKGLVALNTHVYAFDHHHNPAIAENIPPMEAGKVNVMTAQVDDKIYVLSCNPLLSHNCPPKPTFEAYDPATNSWESLPEPPPRDNPDACCSVSSNYVYCLQSLNEKIILHDMDGLWIYDTMERTWSVYEYYLQPGTPYPFSWNGAIASYKGIMVAFTPNEGLVAYLSPNKYRVLREVNQLFPCVNLHRGFLNHFGEGEGRLCALFLDRSAIERAEAIIVIFRLNIDEGGEVCNVFLDRTHTFIISTIDSAYAREVPIPIRRTFISRERLTSPS